MLRTETSFLLKNKQNLLFLSVVLARIKRHRVGNDSIVYKIRIRKDYKLSEKAYVALKSGRIITPRYDSMCGLQLEVGKLYVISGKICF